MLLSMGANPNASVTYGRIQGWMRQSTPRRGVVGGGIIMNEENEPPFLSDNTYQPDTIERPTRQENTSILPTMHSFGLSPSKIQLKVSLLLQAVQANHLKLADLLVEPYRTVKFRSRHAQANPLLSMESLRRFSISSNNSSSPTQSASDSTFSKISQEILAEALSEALKNSQYEMCRILVIKGGAIPTMRMVQDLLLKAGTARFSGNDI
jgi:hypothetical protein